MEWLAGEYASILLAVALEHWHVLFLVGSEQGPAPAMMALLYQQYVEVWLRSALIHRGSRDRRTAARHTLFLPVPDDDFPIHWRHLGIRVVQTPVRAESSSKLHLPLGLLWPSALQLGLSHPARERGADILSVQAR